jgi:hypothetical protein
LSREDLTAIVNAHRAPGQETIAVPSGEPTPIGESVPLIEPPL